MTWAERERWQDFPSKVRGERRGDATRGEKEDDEARKKQWGGEGDGWEREDAACHTGGRRGKNVG